MVVSGSHPTGSVLPKGKDGAQDRIIINVETWARCSIFDLKLGMRDYEQTTGWGTSTVCRLTVQ